MGLKARNPDLDACKQQRSRPACLSMQSDQCLVSWMKTIPLISLISHIVVPNGALRFSGDAAQLLHTVIDMYHNPKLAILIY